MNQRKEGLQPLDILANTLQEALYGGSDLQVSGPPYLRDGVNIQRFLAMPLIAVAPAFLGAIYLFGWHVLLMLIVAWISGGIVEILFALLRNRQPSGGLLVIVALFTMLLPSAVPMWVVAIGAAVAIAARDLFGGIGFYLFNPILVGHAIIILFFPDAMSSGYVQPFWGGAGGFLGWAPQVADGMTLSPLGTALQGGESPYSIGQLILGNVPGPVGTTSGLLMLFAGFWMLMTRTVNWRVSVVVIFTVFLGQAFLQMMFPQVFLGDPLLHVLSGSLLFTAFLIAADSMTSPMTLNGKLLYGLLVGLFILILRTLIWTAVPIGEDGIIQHQLLVADMGGVVFSVLLANALVPVLDRWTQPRSYGGGR